MPSKKTNPWIKFLQSYTKKQQKTNKNYTYKNAIGDKNAKKMYKEMKGGFFGGVDAKEDPMEVTGQEPTEVQVSVADDKKTEAVAGQDPTEVQVSVAGQDPDTEGGRKSCSKKKKMSKKSTSRRRRTSKK